MKGKFNFSEPMRRTSRRKEKSFPAAGERSEPEKWENCNSHLCSTRGAYEQK
jgi:hypothetical protein